MSDEKKIPTQNEGLYDRLGRCDRTEYEHAELHHHIAEVGQSMPPFPCKNWRAGTFTSFTPAAPVSPPRHKPYACVGNSSAAQDERSEVKEVFGEVAPVSPEPPRCCAEPDICAGCHKCLNCYGCDCDDSHPKDCQCRSCCLVREAKTEGAKPEPASEIIITPMESLLKLAYLFSKETLSDTESFDYEAMLVHVHTWTGSQIREPAASPAQPVGTPEKEKSCE